MDARYFKYDAMPDSSPFNNLFKYSDKLSQLKTALHITKPDSFSKLNSTVASELGFDRTSNSTHVYDDLLDRGLQILINVGEFDMKDGVR